MTLQVQDPRKRVVLTMASGVSLSSAVDTMGYRVAALDMSSGWDAANLMSFAVSQTATGFLPLFDETGAEATITSGAFTSSTGRAIALTDTLLIALQSHRYFKVQVGPSTNTTTLTTGVTIGLIMTPV